MVLLRILQTILMAVWTLCCFLPAVIVLIVPWAGSRISHWIARIWGRGMLAVCLVGFRIEGREKLDRKRALMVVANHTSWLDPPTMLWAIPGQIRFVLKKELMQLPLIGWYCHAAGHFLIDRSDPRAGIETARKAVESARSQRLKPMVFPEGTRSVDGRLAPLRAGSFQLAITGRMAVQPIAILGSHEAWPKSARTIRRPGRITVRVGDPIETESFRGSRGRKALADAVTAALIELGVPPAEAAASADPDE